MICATKPKISDGSDFLDYFLSPKSEGDLLPLTDDLIEKLVIQEKIPKDDLLRLANEGFLYSTLKNNFRFTNSKLITVFILTMGIIRA